MEQIITCPNCGQKNRINEEQLSRAKCGKCWSILRDNSSENSSSTSTAKSKSNVSSFYQRSWFWIFVIAGVVLLFMINQKPSARKSNINNQSQTTFTYPVQVTPYNGETKVFTNLQRVAPLRINTSRGSHYLVKLKNAYTKETIMTIFIQGGNGITTEVPLGTYEITYASGEKWYGYQHLFGPKTGFSKADEIFNFRNDGYQITGYTITLYKVSNGNLRTKYINKSEF